MRLWLIPMLYVCASVITGLILPRIEQLYFASYTLNLSVASAQAYLSAAGSGMIALTGIVFALAFVMVQFNAVAYSPRLALWFAGDRTLFHALGIFAATFIYALFALAWVDRGGSGTVPLFSCLLVGILLIVSMLLFSQLVQKLSDLQITRVLQMVGDRGRAVIESTFNHIEYEPTDKTKTPSKSLYTAQLGAITQTVRYSGEPRTIAKFDVQALVSQARQAKGVIVMTCAVGDTLVDDTKLLQIHGAMGRLSQKALLRSVHLSHERTFEQDPKYPIRLLVDIAIKALSAAINDPTTAVQTIDQIEDLLHRLGRCNLDVGYAADSSGAVRLIFPMPTWEDYLTLAFDEIRQYGASSVQVMRRLRAALVGLTESLSSAERADAVKRYLEHLDQIIAHSTLDAQDRLMAQLEDPQGLGLSRRHPSTP
jgi:uncharacterized membrane protein